MMFKKKKKDIPAIEIVPTEMLLYGHHINFYAVKEGPRHLYTMLRVEDAFGVPQKYLPIPPRMLDCAVTTNT